MKVYVVMGNDYPDAVFSTEHAATKYCNQKRNEQPEHVKRHNLSPRIHWRWYEFNLDQKD